MSEGEDALGTMKKGMVMSVVFLGGFAAGALTYGFVAARETQFQNELIQTHFRIEQEFRASRAERGGNLLAALHYRWNSVDAHSRSWMNAIQSWEVPGPWYPVQLHILRSIRGDAKRYEKGVRIAEAIGRGHLAWLLDANGFAERAAQEWERSAELTGRSVAHQKELIHLLRESFDTDAHKAAEVAVLGP
jgi:hypothetical protein